MLNRAIIVIQNFIKIGLKMAELWPKKCMSIDISPKFGQLLDKISNLFNRYH